MEPFPKRGDIVVYLKEQIVLYFLREADTGVLIISS